MVVKCPNCRKQYRVNTANISKSLIKVKCPSCQKFVVINLKKISSRKGAVPDPIVQEARATITAKDVLSESSIKRFGDLLTITIHGREQQPLILIADEPRAFREFLRKSLEELGCRVLVVDDGAAVEEVLRRQSPHIVFLNVVLRNIMGFVLCERLKNDPVLREIKIVLIGAIFRIDRFRRDPTNLYGADDYIEEIIVKQDLKERVKRLLGIRNGGPVELDQTSPHDVVEHARRLARIILSDIIIYNQDRIDRLIRTNTFQTELADELQEGKEYYLQKIPSDRHEVREIYTQTIDEFIKRRKRELSESPTRNRS